MAPYLRRIVALTALAACSPTRSAPLAAGASPCPATVTKETVMPTSTVRDASQVLELRQYTLHPGKREVLIDLFDRLFLDPQEALGMHVLGQFRDLDGPDRFVWLRGFPDLASRAGLLGAFYGGPVWKASREAANATMVDSDNVLLLRPVDADSGLLLPAERRPDAREPPGAFVLVTVYLLDAPADDAFVRLFRAQASPILAEAGGPPLAEYRTEYGRNDFPKLPVREGEHAFVWMTSFASPEDHERFRAELARSNDWTSAVEPALRAHFKSPPQVLRLAPTARSLFRHVEPLGYTTLRKGDPHDFDFLAGDWSVVSRRLKTRGAGAADWEEVPATCHAALHLGGTANVDEIDFPTLGSAGMTVRTFDLAARQWSIRWVSSKTGVMDRGVIGGFAGARGEFYGEDVDGGEPVKVRYVWTRLGVDAARWEQSFSYAGRAWERNWVMTFARAKR